MKGILKNRNFISFLYVFFGFLLTSVGYISWVYHLEEIGTAWSVDVLAMVIAYVFQAVGIVAYTVLMRIKPGYPLRKIFIVPVCILYIFFLFSSMFAAYITGTFFFGFMINLLGGVLLGGCFYCLTHLVDYDKRGTVFGVGYAVSTLVMWLFSLIGHGNFLKSTFSIIVNALIALFLAFAAMTCSKEYFNDFFKNFARDQERKNYPIERRHRNIRIIVISVIFVLCSSMIMKMGFFFPVSDIVKGVGLEYLSLFFASGLLLSGFLIDQKRVFGTFGVLFATLTAFVMIILQKETLPGMIPMALYYFLYGFVVLGRVILFTDHCRPLREERRSKFQAGYFAFGWLIGRIGDSLGTQLGIALSEQKYVMVGLAAVLCIATVFCAVRLIMLKKEEKDNALKGRN